MYKSTLSGVLFALIVKTKFPSVNFFTLALLLMLWTNIRYGANVYIVEVLIGLHGRIYFGTTINVTALMLSFTGIDQRSPL